MVNSSSRHLLDTCDKPDILHTLCNHKPHHQHPSLQMGNEAKVGEHFAQGLAANEWFNLLSRSSGQLREDQTSVVNFIFSTCNFF